LQHSSDKVQCAKQISVSAKNGPNGDVFYFGVLADMKLELQHLEKQVKNVKTKVKRKTA